VVEHSIADRRVLSSNLGAPYKIITRLVFDIKTVATFYLETLENKSDEKGIIYSYSFTAKTSSLTPT
jgi:hypothetical protein